MRLVRRLKCLIPLGLLMFFSVQCHTIGPPPGVPDAWAKPTQRLSSPTPAGQARSKASVSTAGMLREVNVRVDMVKKGSYGRSRARSMTPRYITIHSTQNFTADASRHALALKRGALRTNQRPGYLIWHYTVDDRVAIQHMPTNEQGIHADFDGPGNRYSIGIEMCEHRGNNRAKTVDRTAKLTAILMKRNGIPLHNVEPHYHWPRKGKKPPNKNCPHFLLDNGKPGRKWRAFLAQVNYHYQRLE